ncbi:lipid-binding protein [uncultured Proteiniphilum sp.]|uniref:lipid-binding protein n=1 Tax=uncultured Proteiniphilum sp. TaxID=497637 RepID=UPI002618319C|nr:lipid-binding protein [uncultured Proteiniphilum sp.]
MKKNIYLLGLIILGVFASCERETESKELTDTANSVKITGQWEVTAYNDSTTIFGPFKVITLKDTSAGNDSITIQDSEVKFWKFQVKAAADEKNGTFETKLSTCEISEEGIGIKISNGKILNSDSIYFEIQFEDDETPYGKIYQLKGHRING